MSNIIDSIKLSGTVYTLSAQTSGGGGNPTVELTQAEYDALISAGTVSADTYYIITDATPVDMGNYWTSAQTNSAITQATSGKVDSSSVVTTVTSGSTNSEIPTAKAVYDAIPTGGSVSYSAGTNISIANDTISCTLPITASSSIRKNDITIGNDIVNGNSDYRRIIIGNGNKFKYNSSRSSNSILIGVPNANTTYYNIINATECIGIGGGGLEVGYDDYTGYGSIGIGYGAKSLINKSLAIGHNAVASGATKTNINNQLTIDTSNQVYISNSANTSTYCLQTKLETTEAALGGLKLQQITQADYDALVQAGTVDASTLYVVVNNS